MASGKKITIQSDPMRHLNKQAFGVDSSVVIGESIANPAYREAARDAYLGIMVTAVTVWPKFTVPFSGALVTSIWQSQLQTGNQSGTPAIMNLDGEFLFAAGLHEISALSGVGFGANSRFPLSVEPVKGINIIVTPEFTVVHDAGVNNARFASDEVHTVLEYSIVKVPDRLFTQMLMNQSRTS